MIGETFSDQARELLAELMAEQNVSCRQLGKRTGIADSTIGRFLKGEHTPSLDMYARMLDGLQVRPTLYAEPAF